MSEFFRYKLVRRKMSIFDKQFNWEIMKCFAKIEFFSNLQKQQQQMLGKNVQRCDFNEKSGQLMIRSH